MSDRTENIGLSGIQRATENRAGAGIRKDSLGLLLERLKAEAILLECGLRTTVADNRILVHFDECVVVVQLSQPNEAVVNLSVRLVLGQVTLADEARAFAETNNREIGPLTIEVDETGVVSVHETESFEQGIDGRGLAMMMNEVCKIATDIRRIMEEDFYLKPLALHARSTG